MDSSFPALMEQVMAGSEEAAERLFRDYEPVLLRVIRRRLPRQMRPRFDSLDFAQDVWKSFFAQRPEQRVFNAPKELISYLAQLAKNKVINASRHNKASRGQSSGREVSLDDSRLIDKGALMSPQPTASQIAMSEEEWAAFLDRQLPVHRRIYVLLRQGRTSAQIARELKINLRFVQRVIERLRPEAPS